MDNDTQDNLTSTPARIALISTGLGHITRGIETWTDQLGKELKARDVDVFVYKGGGRPLASHEGVVRCLKRDHPFSKWVIANRPGFLWRFGLATGYTLEQLTFTICILPDLIKKKYDIIHTQDPQVAEYLQRFARRGWLKSRVILAHGTEEPHEYLAQFNYLQHLAPYHLEETQSHGYTGRVWTAIGNFIDTEKYRPGRPRDLRGEFGIPDNAFVVLSVAAIKRTHKRIHHLIREVAHLRETLSADEQAVRPVYLVVAGSRNEETPVIEAYAQELLGEHAKLISDFPQERIPEVLAMADVFCLCSLKDMMPIALIEALASGLPCVTHTYPVEVWMIGPGGDAIDMEREGALAETLATYYRDEPLRQGKAEHARRHAIDNFSRERILEDILAMYEQVMDD